MTLYISENVTKEHILINLVYIGYRNNSEKRNLKLLVDTYKCEPVFRDSAVIQHKIQINTSTIRHFLCQKVRELVFSTKHIFMYQTQSFV